MRSSTAFAPLSTQSVNPTLDKQHKPATSVVGFFCGVGGFYGFGRSLYADFDALFFFYLLEFEIFILTFAPLKCPPMGYDSGMVHSSIG